MNYMAQDAAAKAEEQYTNDLNDSTLKQNQAEMGNINLRLREGEDIASRKDNEIVLAGMKNESSARVGALESGAGGQSMDAYMNDFRAHSARMRYAVGRDQKSDTFKYHRSMEQQKVAALGQIRSQSRPIAQASGAASALEFAGSAMAIKSDYNRTKAISSPKVSGAKPTLDDWLG
jgi:hypothetical protein